MTEQEHKLFTFLDELGNEWGTKCYYHRETREEATFHYKFNRGNLKVTLVVDCGETRIEAVMNVYELIPRPSVFKCWDGLEETLIDFYKSNPDKGIFKTILNQQEIHPLTAENPIYVSKVFSLVCRDPDTCTLRNYMLMITGGADEEYMAFVLVDLEAGSYKEEVVSWYNVVYKAFFDQFPEFEDIYGHWGDDL